MQTINFFILPIKSFENLESKILKLKEVSDIIKVNFDNIIDIPTKSCQKVKSMV